MNNDFSLSSLEGDVIVTTEEVLVMFVAMFERVLPEPQKPYAQEIMPGDEIFIDSEHASRMWQVIVNLWDSSDEESLSKLPKLHWMSRYRIPWKFLGVLEKCRSLNGTFSTDLARKKIVLRCGGGEELDIKPSRRPGFIFRYDAGGEGDSPSLAFVKAGVYDLVAEQEPGTIWGLLKPQLEALAAERRGVQKVEIIPEW